MKRLEKIVTNPFLVGLIMLKDLIDIIKSLVGTNPISFKNIHIDWWDFSIKLFIATVLWLTLNAYFKLKKKFEDEMEVANLISHIRNQRLFIRSFNIVQFNRLPNETDEQFYNRLPEGGLFRQHYFEEYEIVKAELQNQVMTDKSLNEIDKLLSSWYPFTRNNNDTTQ